MRSTAAIFVSNYKRQLKESSSVLDFTCITQHRHLSDPFCFTGRAYEDRLHLNIDSDQILTIYRNLIPANEQEDATEIGCVTKAFF